MKIHYLLSKKVRDYSLFDISELNEESAEKLLQEIHWGSKDTQICPKCGVENKHYRKKTRRQWQCKDCGHTFSVTSGTIFADRKLSFKKILMCIFEFTSSSNGISASSLSRKMGITYKSTWLFLGKLREVLIRHQDLTPLSGTIQIDGTYIGGKLRKGRLKNMRNNNAIKEKVESNGKRKRRLTSNDIRNFKRKKENRRLVLVFTEVHMEKGKGSKRVIPALTDGETEANVKVLVDRLVKSGSYIMTDENSAYNFLSTNFEHDTVEHSKEYATIDGVNNNQAECYNSRLKRNLFAVTHRSMPAYAYDYTVEIGWRENMRRESERTRFIDILSNALFSKPSEWWRRYNQGYRRNNELMLYPLKLAKQ